MSTGDVDVVLAQLEAYRAQDRAAAEQLLGDDLRFTSPQDDRIDKAAFLERCFPTAHRFVRQEVREAAEIAPGVVLLRYVAQLDGGAPFSNVEIMRVKEGRIVDIKVYFGGADSFDATESA